MKRIALLLAAAIAVVSVGVGIGLTQVSAAPEDCTNGPFTIKETEILLGLGRSTGDSLSLGSGDDPTLYIDDRDTISPNGNGFWIYMESNGVHGLQRGGTSAVTGERDACDDGWTGEPDTVIF